MATRFVEFSKVDEDEPPFGEHTPVSININHIVIVYPSAWLNKTEVYFVDESLCTVAHPYEDVMRVIREAEAKL